MPATSVLLIGCGNMGSALVRGWAGSSDVRIQVVEPHDLSVDITPFISVHARSLDDLPKNLIADVIFLAIKPQQMDVVLPRLTPFVKNETLIISIAAGRSLSSIAEFLPHTSTIVRAMPNLPAAIGAGITAACAIPSTSAHARDIASHLLFVTGDLVWIDNESQIDAITALSGSGPAYVFLMVEAMAKAGEDLGLPGDLAMRLARQTVIGSGGMMARFPELPASTLRQNVTSPGGTTASALSVLMEKGGFDALMSKAIRAAYTRSRELVR